VAFEVAKAIHAPLDLMLSERRYGSLERSFQLPEGVEDEKIEASFDKGCC
jgi:HSP20 family molecular chaperone IbpA